MRIICWTRQTHCIFTIDMSPHSAENSDVDEFEPDFNYLTLLIQMIRCKTMGGSVEAYLAYRVCILKDIDTNIAIYLYLFYSMLI